MGKLDIHMQENEIGPSPYTIYKNIKTKNKNSDENGESFIIQSDSEFLDMMPKA